MLVSIQPTAYPGVRSVHLNGQCMATVGTTSRGYDALLWDHPKPISDLGRFPTFSDALGAILRAVKS